MMQAWFPKALLPAALLLCLAAAPLQANTPPPAPSNISALGDHVIDANPKITWNSDADADGDIITTYIFVGVDLNPTDTEAFTRQGEGYLGNTIPLSRGILYSYRLRSWDGTDWSDYTDNFIFKRNTPPPAPYSTDLSMFLTDSSPVIYWTGGGGDADNDDLEYHLYFGTSPYPNQIVWTDYTGEETSYKFSGLASGVSYYWRIVAFDGYENSSFSPSSPGDQFRVNTLPSKPVITAALGSNLTQHNPVIDWTTGDSEGSRVFTYIEVSTSSSGPYAAEKFTWLLQESLGGTVPLRDGQTYYLRLRAFDGYQWSAYSDIRSFRMNTPPGAAYGLSQLGDHVVDTRPQVSWFQDSDSEGDTVVSYIFIDTQALPSTLDGYALGTSFSIGSGISLDEGGGYYYRIRNYDGYEWSDYSSTSYFKMNASPSAPEWSSFRRDHITDLKPSVYWKTAVDADSDPVKTSIYIGTIPTKYTIEKTVAGSTSASIGDTVPLTKGGAYYLCLRNWDGYIWSDYSDSLMIRLNSTPPVPYNISPFAGAAVTGRTSLQWLCADPDQDPVNFEIRISSHPGFSASDLYETSIPASYISLDGLAKYENIKDNLTYYWRIRAYDTYEYSSWSDSRTFIFNKFNNPPGPPQVNYPLSGDIINTQSPLIRWSAASDSDPGDTAMTLKYFIALSTDRNFVRYSGYYSNKGETSIRFPEILKDDTLWYIKILTIDSYGESSSWTQPLSFYTNLKNNPPSAPQNFTKAGAMSDTPVRFYWSFGGDMDPDDTTANTSYRLFIKEKNSDYSMEITAPAGETSDVTRLLKDNTVYLAKVMAVDKGGLNSVYTDWIEFTLNVSNDRPPTPDIVSPPAGANITRRDELLWTEVTDMDPFDAVNYMIEISQDTDFTKPLISEGNLRKNSKLIYKFIQYTLLRENSFYYWRVMAVDAAGAKSFPQAVTSWFKFSEVNDTPLIAGSVTINKKSDTSLFGGDTVIAADTSLLLVSDPDGDSVGVLFIWYLNNREYLRGETLFALAERDFSVGDNLRCHAAPYDGVIAGAPLVSNQVVVNKPEPVTVTPLIKDMYIYAPSSLSFRFDRPMNYTLFNDTNIALYENGQVISKNMTFDSLAVSVIPLTAFTYLSEYELVVSRRIEDIAGQVMPDTVTLKYRIILPDTYSDTVTFGETNIPGLMAVSLEKGSVFVSIGLPGGNDLISIDRAYKKVENDPAYLIIPDGVLNRTFELEIKDNKGVVLKSLENDIKLIYRYPDEDQDGVIDGTVVPERNLKLVYLDEVEEIWRDDLSTSINLRDNYAYSRTPDVARIYGIIGYKEEYRGNINFSVYPNPFIPELQRQAVFQYNLEALSDIELSIYNVNGSLVRTLSFSAGQEETQVGNNKKIFWDGANEGGLLAGPGVYISRLRVETLSGSVMNYFTKIAVIR